MKIAARIILIWAALDVVAAYFWYRFIGRHQSQTETEAAMKWFRHNYPFFILAAVVVFIIWWLAGVTLS